MLTFAFVLRSTADGSRVEQVRLAGAANAADRRTALLEGREAAIPTASVVATAILGTPGLFERRPHRRGESRQGCDCGNSYHSDITHCPFLFDKPRNREVPHRLIGLLAASFIN